MKTLASKTWVQSAVVLVGKSGGEAHVNLDDFRALLYDWLNMHATLEAKEIRRGKEAKR